MSVVQQSIDTRSPILARQTAVDNPPSRLNVHCHLKQATRWPSAPRVKLHGSEGYRGGSWPFRSSCTCSIEHSIRHSIGHSIERSYEKPTFLFWSQTLTDPPHPPHPAKPLYAAGSLGCTCVLLIRGSCQSKQSWLDMTETCM